MLSCWLNNRDTGERDGDCAQADGGEFVVDRRLAEMCIVLTAYQYVTLLLIVGCAVSYRFKIVAYWVIEDFVVCG